MPGNIAIAVPYKGHEGLQPNFAPRTTDTLAFALARLGRKRMVFPIKDGDVTYARAVAFALAHQWCREDGDRIASFDADVGMPPEPLLLAAELAAPDRIIALPYKARHGERDFVFCLPVDDAGNMVCRMHYRDVAGVRVRTVDVTRAGLGAQLIHPDTFTAVCRKLGVEPFYFDLGADAMKGYAWPVFDPVYLKGEHGRLYRHDDSYTWCVRALDAGVRIELLVDHVSRIVHDGLVNGEDLEQELVRLTGDNYLGPAA